MVTPLARAAATIAVRACWVCRVSPLGAVTLLRRKEELIACFFDTTGMPSTTNGFDRAAPARVSLGGVVLLGFATVGWGAADEVRVADGRADVRDGTGDATLCAALGTGEGGGADAGAEQAASASAATSSGAVSRAWRDTAPPYSGSAGRPDRNRIRTGRPRRRIRATSAIVLSSISSATSAAPWLSVTPNPLNRRCSWAISWPMKLAVRPNGIANAKPSRVAKCSTISRGYGDAKAWPGPTERRWPPRNHTVARSTR